MDHLNRPKRGRPKTYKTREKLRKAVEAYFSSITFLNAVKGEGGVPVLNLDEEPIWYADYAVPPSVEALSLFIGITDRTWRNYREQAWAREVCEDAETRIKAWRVSQTCTREKTQGLQFLLKNDSGMTDSVKVEMEQPLSMSERRALLDEVKQMMEEDGL